MIMIMIAGVDFVLFVFFFFNFAPFLAIGIMDMVVVFFTKKDVKRRNRVAYFI